MDVILQGLTGLLLAALEVPRVSRVDICPLEISNENPLEVHPVVDAIVREEFESCSNMFPHIYGEELNDEVIIIHSPGSTGELEVFEPYTGIRLPDIFGDVGRRSEALWERRSPDASAKGSWSQAIQARTSIAGSVTMPRVRFTGPLDDPAGAHLVCSHRRPTDNIIMSGLMPVADDAANVLVRPEAFVHRRSVWSGCRVRPWCSCAHLFRA